MAMPTPIEPTLIKFLRDLLTEAEAGRLTGLAAIIPVNGQVQVAIHGAASPTDLYFGSGILQQQILEKAMAKQSSIMKPPTGGFQA